MSKQQLETVGIKALRDALSTYVRKVSLGIRVLVSDRGKIVAEIVSPSGQHEYQSELHPRLCEWIDDGIVKPGKKKRTRLSQIESTTKNIDIAQLLNSERGER